MDAGLVVQAIGLFAVTNVDDLVVITVFFGRAVGREQARRVVVGQYLGFGAILAVSVVAALGARLLPEGVVPYLGLVPLLLGLRAGWDAWRNRAEDGEAPSGDPSGPGVATVAGVTFANGGDNIGVYVPVFATSSGGSMTVHLTVFLVLVGVWCLAGHWFARRPAVARTLARWGHVVLPVVLVGIGLTILVHGGAFGL